MSSDVISIGETTQSTISGQWVGVSNIFERDIPDERGVIEARLSANVTVHDPNSKLTRDEKVIVGSVVLIGVDRYKIIGIEAGEMTPGKIVIQKSE